MNRILWAGTIMSALSVVAPLQVGGLAGEPAQLSAPEIEPAEELAGRLVTAVQGGPSFGGDEPKLVGREDVAAELERMFAELAAEHQEKLFSF